MIQSVEKVYMPNDNTVFIYKMKTTDGIVSDVPHDTANRHYQEILEWVANGGTIIDNGS